MSRRRHRNDDPIERYREWADNRYNPGHWLGANVPPGLQNLWSPKDRRWLGSAYVAVSVIGLVALFYKVADPDALLMGVLMLSLFLIPGLIMLLARDSKGDRADPPDSTS